MEFGKNSVGFDLIYCKELLYACSSLLTAKSTSTKTIRENIWIQRKAVIWVEYDGTLYLKIIVVYLLHAHCSVRTENVFFNHSSSLEIKSYRRLKIGCSLWIFVKALDALIWLGVNVTERSIGEETTYTCNLCGMSPPIHHSYPSLSTHCKKNNYWSWEGW